MADLCRRRHKSAFIAGPNLKFGSWFLRENACGMEINMNENINMIVSPVCSKNGEKFAYVSFTDGKCTADGRIPECKITSNKGFEQKDIEVLELYMKSNLAKLKRMASGVNIIDAFMK